MEFLEKDLEEIIYNAYKDYPIGDSPLYEKGLDINGFIKRQVRVGDYGVADLVTLEKGFSHQIYPFFENCYHIGKNNIEYEKAIRITVYELKKDKIGISAFLQAVNYAKGIKEFLLKRGYSTNQIDLRIVLIGKTVDVSGSFIFLTDLFYQISFYTYKYDFNGIYFTEEKDYRMNNPKF
tara:strand:- start:572 stop:1108 length:537 start_codon:yes stop_codon:yes gene_type:complete